MLKNSWQTAKVIEAKRKRSFIRIIAIGYKKKLTLARTSQVETREKMSMREINSKKH
jgi:hypothetical protein